jgi:acetyl/propionyl-CoA carboxylase alpha subunit
MSNEIDFDEILSKYRSDPFDYVDVCATHTGTVTFKVVEGDDVQAPSGEWLQIPGTALYEINRERNPKLIAAQTNGVVSTVRTELEGKFVEAGERLITIKHPLKKKEIIENILKEVLYLFRAPERAKYFFALDVQSRIEKKGARAVTVDQGEEVLTMSLMKRDTPIYYSGERGVIHSVYFKPGVSVSQGEPLLGVCAPEKLPLIQKIITRVKADWDTE